MNSIPIDNDLYSQFPNTKIVFNTSIWTTQEEGVLYTSTNYLNQTTSLAIQDPNLLISGYLIDWIVKERLFTQYLKKQCIPFTEEKQQLQDRIEQSNWPQPVRVYGYNALDVVFGGDLFEAETDCIHKMGQIASSHTSNLAFWSTVRPFDMTSPPGSDDGPLIQTSPLPSLVYNSSKIYVTLVYGDMDNLDFVTQWAYHHMIYRSKVCEDRLKWNNKSECFPFVWTLSPNLVTVAPAIMRWYYQMASVTQRDWFIMPPSGSLYSYPGPSPSLSLSLSFSSLSLSLSRLTRALYTLWISM